MSKSCETAIVWSADEKDWAELEEALAMPWSFDAPWLHSKAALQRERCEPTGEAIHLTPVLPIQEPMRGQRVRPEFVSRASTRRRNGHAQTRGP